MAKKLLKVTDYELAVLEVIWERGSASIREITDKVYQKPSTANYATVQKLLERLEEKGCVSRDRSSFAHTFRAEIDRAELIDEGLEGLAEQLCGGSLTPLLVHLVGKKKLSRKQRDMLRELIDEAK